jgi:REP element-mobilizing transposase RayT
VSSLQEFCTISRSVGNYGQTVFHRNEDRRFYLTLLSEFLPHYGITLEAYCLMSNLVHLIATPHEQKG